MIGSVLASITWNVDPSIFTLGGFQLRYYSLLWTLGIVLGYFILLRFAKTEGVPERVMDRLALYSVIGVIIGARLGHCFVYEPLYYLQHPLEVLQVWKGGLASHGGGVGVMIGMYIASRQERVSMLWVMDRVVIPIALIASFIRWGNLFNSEIYGHATTLPWGFVFARNGETEAMHPTQIYEALSYFTVFVGLMWAYFRRPVVRAKRGLIFSIFLITMFTARILIEFIKHAQESFEKGWLLNLGQLQSLPFLLFGIGLFVWGVRRAPVTPPHFAPEPPVKSKSRSK